MVYVWVWVRLDACVRAWGLGVDEGVGVGVVLGVDGCKD